jgi:hypothetical protein
MALTIFANQPIIKYSKYHLKQYKTRIKLSNNFLKKKKKSTAQSQTKFADVNQLVQFARENF